MKFTEENINAMVASFCKNPKWKKLYDDAPEKARARLRIAFWAGGGGLDEKEDLDLYRQAREEAERELSFEDAQYLAANFPEGSAKKHYEELFERVRYAPLMKPELLDAAVATLMEGCSSYERDCYDRTMTALRECEDGWVKYDWFWKAVGGHGETCLLVGDIFDHGHGVKCDESLALFWFKKGALCGDGESCYRLACLYEDEKSGRFDMGAALFWFREGLRRRCRLAQVKLAERLLFGDGAWLEYRNPALAHQVLGLEIGRDEDGAASFLIGRAYEEGAGIPKSLEDALTFYKLAKMRGCESAQKAIKRIWRLMKKKGGGNE